MNAQTTDTTPAPATIGTATYSPEDNKLRIYPLHRLDTADYNLLKEAGFKWAPKQELFVAPMWTPQREDLILELCGEVGDEDTSLVDRASERAERFEDYSEKRSADATRAHSAVKALADNIPFGQPILVGHHSERHARKDAARIENGMRHAVKMWDTAQYWERRAAGAVYAAKYKELPAVRHRRIKTIEADKRKQERALDELQKMLKFWSADNIALPLALKFCGYIDRGGVRLADGSKYWCAYSALDDGRVSLEELRAQRLASLPRQVARVERWINHYNNRVAYESAMLQAQGGTAADKFDIVVGGRVQVRGEWCTVLRVNRQAGAINSVTTNRRYVAKVGIEDVQGYEPPDAAQAAAVAAAVAKAPLCNYPAESVGVLNIYHGTTDVYKVEPITKAEWAAVHTDYKGSRDVPATDTAARHRVRIIMKGGGLRACFITDQKRTDPPAPTPAAQPVAVPPVVRAMLPDPPAEINIDMTPAPDTRAAARVTPADVAAMRDAIKQGVQVQAVPQLFPTPRDIAEKMELHADIQPGDRCADLSAGTGALIGAMGGRMFQDTTPRGSVTAVEIHAGLCARLRVEFPLTRVICADFLQLTGDDCGPFDKILLNPPFENGADIKHIQHAAGFLAPGGVMVALCAAGPRQHAALQPMADYWEVLPAGTFKAQGTGVNVAFMVIKG